MPLLTELALPQSQNLSGLRAAKSRAGFSLERIWAMSLPVMGPRLRPIMAWPVAAHRFG